MGLFGRRLSDEEAAELDRLVIRALGIIFEADGRGAAHPISLSIMVNAGGDSDFYEKDIARSLKRLQSKGHVRVDRLGDAYITEAGVEYANAVRTAG